MISIGITTNRRSFVKSLRQARLNGERAVKSSFRSAATETQARWRAQIVKAGLIRPGSNKRLDKTIRSETYPQAGGSFGATSLVWTRAPKIIAAHIRGGVSKPVKGRWIAIPLRAAGRQQGKEPLTPETWTARTGIKLRYAQKGPNRFLVADNVVLGRGGTGSAGIARASRAKTARGKKRAQSANIFLLKKRTTLPKRLNLQAIVNSVGNKLPANIVKRWQT